MYNKNIFTYTTIFLFLAASFYLSGIMGPIKFLASLFIYTLIFYLLHYIWIKIKQTPIIPFGDFIHYFLWRISLILVFVTLFIGWLSYLSNEIFPAPMPEYTISNGTKTVKFQSMSHIGTQDFYNQVKENLVKNKQDGYVYFYEGVKPGTEENLDKFNKAIGIEFDENLYENFSKLYGVTNQDNRDFLGLVNNLDFNVDVDMNKVIKLYESKKSQDKQITTSSGITVQEKEPIDLNKAILETLSSLNDKELKILIYVNQAILNFIIGNQTTQDFLANNFTNDKLFDVILGERNKVVIEEINNSKYNKIYTTYGLLHFDGIFEGLKQKDSKWEILETNNLYPIKN